MKTKPFKTGPAPPFAVVETLGQEWCKPLGDARLVDYITIGANGLHAVLCRVERCQLTGEIRRVMLRRNDLESATDLRKW